MTEKLVYRTEEARSKLGIGKTTFWKLVKAGQLEIRKLGGTTVVPAESLHSFVAGLPKVTAG
jgi:excisionase family DNA binding protein